MKRFLLKLIGVTLLAWLIKLLLLTFYMVPSDSMIPSLLRGDGIIVNKLAYGPRINTSFFKQLNSKNPTFFKFPGLYEIKREDVFVFLSPKDMTTTLVKRCTGLPGDTLMISGSRLLLNSNINHKNLDILTFKIEVNNLEKFTSFIDSVNISAYRIANTYSFTFRANLNIANQLAGKSFTKKLNRVHKPKSENQESIFPEPYGNLWDKNNYGAMTVPKEGQVLLLNRFTVEPYRNIIKQEDLSFYRQLNKVLERDKFVRYRFKNNYYFVLGDNRDISYDSRWLGFIPENLIIGKVEYIIYSRDPDLRQMRFKRFLKRVN